MKKTFILLFTTCIIGLGIMNVLYSQDEHSPVKETELEQVAVEHQNYEHLSEHNTSEHADEGHGDSDHGGGMEPLLFVIVALIIGAATRHFLRNIPLPFTVMLLLIGIILGIGTRVDYFEGFDSINKAISWAGNIDPHLILFVFLPTLIFEAAFAMDVHTFKKIFVNAFLLAVPGISIALFLTAGLVILTNKFGLGFNGWEWPIALMFGSVISATDPVAVVALLKELGASKKLGTLIEGESLLNDGTAIVIFMVFFIGLTQPEAESAPMVVEFVKVALGGTLLGLIIGGVTIAWVKKVFNDVLVEMTVIVAAAYLTFFVAEHFLHVSGVLGLVALGLTMAGVGRTRISPEVEHFLHEFWEMAAFIANTLIFIIVGVVIAQRTVFTGHDFLILGLIYVGIHIIRAFVILVLYPVMRKAGYGLPKKDAYVVWWGALRGAIGLALALVVVNADERFIPQEIRDQFLFLIAGTVTLSLLINATTIKALVNMLGLTKVPAAKALMMSNAYKQLTLETENTMDLLKDDRFLSGANWESVREYIPETKDPEINEDEIASMDTIAETRRRILEKEKSSYWHQFRDGLLGPVAVRRLADGLNDIIDKGGTIPLTDRPYMDKLWETPSFLNKILTVPLLRGFAQRSLSERLALSYDMTRGFIVAQEEVIQLVQTMAIGEEGETSLVDDLKAEIHENKIQGLTYLRNIREAYPEIAAAISTKQATRSVLNFERNSIKNLVSNGRLELDEAEKIMSSVEARMKMLMDSPPSIKLPEPIELLKEVPWLRGLDDAIYGKVVELVDKKVYSAGSNLMELGGPGDGLYIIAGGTVRVTVKDFLVDILGPGSVIGEMAVLTGLPRTATVTAETPVTALWVPAEPLKEVRNLSKELNGSLWKKAGTRFAENLLKNMEPYSLWRQVKFRRWLEQGEVVVLNNGETLAMEDKVAVLLKGEAIKSDNTNIQAPAVLEKDKYSFNSESRVYIREIKLE